MSRFIEWDVESASEEEIPSSDDIPSPPVRPIVASPPIEDWDAHRNSEDEARFLAEERLEASRRTPKRAKRTKRFRFNATRVALTYSQCDDLTVERCLAFMDTKFGVKHYFLRRCEHDEEHEGWHIHAYFEFNTKLDLSSERAFDIDGRHPNIKEIKRGNKGREGWLKYIDEENTGEEILKDIERDAKGIQRWAFEAIAVGNEHGIDAAWDFLKRTEPARCLEKGGQLKANLMMILKRAPTFIPMFPQGSPMEAPGLEDKQSIKRWFTWFVEGIAGRRRFKLLVVVSPGGWGKTEWVRCLDGNPDHHAYFANRFNVANLRPEQRYWVWEDVNFWDPEFKSRKALLTGNASRVAEADGKWIPQLAVDVKPSVWLCNSIPFEGYKNEQERTWWYDNSFIVTLAEPLYNRLLNDEFC